MLSASSDFSIAAKLNPRKCKAKIDIVWNDSGVDTSLTASSNDENRAAILPQVYDEVKLIPKRWAHLNGDQFLGLKADGSFYPMPTSSDTEQVGWYGATRGDADGEFTTNPTLTVEFDARPVYSLYVAGDSTYLEYPVDFTIKAYSGAGGTVLNYIETVTGNTSLYWTKGVQDQNLTNMTKIVLEISKWSAGYAIPKIAEFYTDFSQTIENENISSINVLEERIISDGTVPLGNISSNEIDITLQNISIDYEGSTYLDPFFPSNPFSPYRELLTKGRKVTPYLGFVLESGSTEYVKMGTYWTEDWDVSEQSATCSVSARDRMERLRLAEYKGSTLYTNTSLYALMEALLNSAKSDIPMPDLEWEIDTELTTYIIPYAWLPKSSYFNSIKTIVSACMGVAYMSRDDVLIIEGPSALTS